MLVLAARAAGGATREEDLAALRSRIEALHAELEQKQTSRRETRDALRESEAAISRLARELRVLDARGVEIRSQLKTLAERQSAAEDALGNRRAVLEKILAARYLGGAPEVLRIALSGDDPNDSARRLYYVSVLSAAAARTVDSYRASLIELESLRRSTLEQSAALDSIERARRADHERVLAERRERQRVMAEIASGLRQGRNRLRTLQADATRLARVVEEISRVLSARPGAGHGPATVEPAPAAGAPFSRQRGKLKLPVRGELIGRFGAQHEEGAGARKGIFIRSPEGEAVHAVAAGRVVFADWMRGLGNLLIVDHGEAYLSVYGNNESLLKQAGDAVAAGDPVATVGATGGNEQTGLYFELRHLGKAFDPLRWVGR